MPLSNIFVIVIRLFSLNWCLHALALMLSSAPLHHERSVSAVLMHYAPAVLLLIVAVVPGFSRRLLPDLSAAALTPL
jgi:hypothetical protein